MRRFRRILKRIFCLPPLAAALVAAPCFALVIYVLSNGLEGTPLASAAYPLSAYALVVVCAAVPDAVRWLRYFIHNNRLVYRLLSIPLGERFVRDDMFRAELGLYRSLFINLLYAALKLGTGIALRSVWFTALGVYYLLLALMRYLLQRRIDWRAEVRDIPWELKRCRTCGVVLLLMTQALAGIVVLMVLQRGGYHYPGLLIYGMALYTFYAVTIACIHVARFRRKGSPVLYAAKALNLVAALVSLLALETAMITEFGGDEAYRRMMVGITGAAVCAATFAVAVVMIARATRGLKEAEA